MNFNVYSNSSQEYQLQVLRECTRAINNAKRQRLEFEDEDIENLPLNLLREAISAKRKSEECKTTYQTKTYKVTPINKYRSKVVKACESNGVTKAEYEEFMKDFNIGKTGKVPTITIAMLRKAVTNSNDRMLKTFKELGADLNQTDSEGRTCVTYAVTEDKEDMVRLLAELGADLNDSSLQGNFPLTQAIEDHNDEMIQLLLELKADPNHISIEKKTTPLKEAVYQNNADAIELLVEAGADLNLKSLLDDTPLVDAIHFENIPLVKLLIRLGADVNHFSGKKSTPLIEASVEGQSEIIKLLIKSGADLNLSNELGKPPLAYAIQNLHCKSSELLQQSGANFDISTEIIRRIVLGNIWSLKGKSTINWTNPLNEKNYTYFFDIEGGFEEHFLSLFIFYLNAFFESHNQDGQLLSKESMELIRQGFKNSFDLFKTKSKEVQSQIKTKIPHIILGGSNEHVVSIIIYHETITVFNRGDGALEHAANSYQLPLSKITKTLISQLRKTYNDMNEFNAMIDSLNLEYAWEFDQRLSRVGNCPWASLKGALKVILLMIIKEESANQIYKQFTNFVREESLKNYLHETTDVSKSLIKKIRKKLINKSGFLKSKELLATKGMWPT